MNNLQIPTKFELARIKHSVKIVEYIDDEFLGTANGNSNVILIAEHSKRTAVPKDKQINTFYHELVHQIFFTIERDDLGKDEVLVTAIGNMLMEFDLTRDGIPVKLMDTSIMYVDE